MKVKVLKDKLIIETDYSVNDGEYKINKCEFLFDEEYNDLIKKAIFVKDEQKIEMLISNNECDIPSEVLYEGTVELHVYAYKVENDELILRYSPLYDTFTVRKGSYLEETTNPREITPSQFEQFETALNSGLKRVNDNLNIITEETKKVVQTGVKVENQGRYAESVADDIKKRADAGEFNGKDGKNGEDGYTPIKNVDYFDGKDGLPGKDGATGPQGLPGKDGKDGINGENGKDAKINGVNTLTIIEGENVKLEQTGSTLKISSTGGTPYDDTEIKEKINLIDADLGTAQSDIQTLQNDIDNLEDSLENKQNTLTKQDKDNLVKESLINNSNQLSDEEQIKIETWLGLAHNYLTYYNTTPYQVNGDYIPAHKKYVDSVIPSTDDFISKKFTGTNILNGKIQIGDKDSAITNAILHIRNVGSSSITGKNVNGACYSVNSDGTASLQHKTYNDDGSGAKNTAVLRMSNKGIQFAINTGSGATPSETDYQELATQKYVDDVVGDIESLLGGI